MHSALNFRAPATRASSDLRQRIPFGCDAHRERSPHSGAHVGGNRADLVVDRQPVQQLHAERAHGSADDAAPGPGADNRVDDRGQHNDEDEERPQLHPFGQGAGHNRGRGGHEHHIAGSSATLSFAADSGVKPDGEHWVFLEMNEGSCGRGGPRRTAPTASTA